MSSSDWMDVSPYTLPLIDADKVVDIDEYNATTTSFSYNYTINLGGTPCAGRTFDPYARPGLPQQNAAITFAISSTIYSNLRRVRVVYYNGSGYSQTLGSVNISFALKQSGSSYTLTMFFEGIPESNRTVLYNCQLLNSSDTTLQEIKVMAYTYGTYGYANLTYNMEKNGAVFATKTITTGVGSIEYHSNNSTSYFYIFFPTYVYVTDELFKSRSSQAPIAPNILNGYPMCQNSSGLWIYPSATAYAGQTISGTNWIPFANSSGNYTVSLDYDTNEYVDMYYTTYDNTGTPRLVSMGNVQAGTTLTTPSEASAGSVPGHKFKTWRYKDTDYAPSMSFITYPFYTKVAALWDPLKFRVYHNGAWQNTGVFIAYNGNWTPPDAIKVYHNGDWVDI